MNTDRKFRVIRIVAGLAFGVSMVALNATAFADEPATPSVRVPYADLNLNSSADIKVLYRRLTSASAAVCGDSNPFDLAVHRQYEICYQRALEKAVSQVRSPELSALHRYKNTHSSDWS